jgi:hypothetical protein
MTSTIRAAKAATITATATTRLRAIVTPALWRQRTCRQHRPAV